MINKRILVGVLFILSIVVISVFIISCGKVSVTEEKNTEAPSPGSIRLSLASSPSTSALYTYQVAWAKAVSDSYPEISITIMESGGAADSLRRVRDGMVQVGNSTADLIYQGYHGEGQFAGDPKDNMRMLWSQPAGAYQIIVSERSGITKVEELQGKPFISGGTGTSASAFVKQMLELLGVVPQYFEASQSDAVDAISNRQVVGVVKYGPTPDSYIAQIQANTPIRVLSLTNEEVNVIKDKFPWISEYGIAPNTYGNAEAIQTISSGAGTFATTDMDIEVAYKMASAYFDKGKDIWLAAYPAYATEDHVKITLESSVIPLHAGVVKFLKEKGYNVPKELIPPEY